MIAAVILDRGFFCSPARAYAITAGGLEPPSKSLSQCTPNARRLSATDVRRTTKKARLISRSMHNSPLLAESGPRLRQGQDSHCLSSVIARSKDTPISHGSLSYGLAINCKPAADHPGRVSLGQTEQRTQIADSVCGELSRRPDYVYPRRGNCFEAGTLIKGKSYLSCAEYEACDAGRLIVGHRAGKERSPAPSRWSSGAVAMVYMPTGIT